MKKFISTILVCGIIISTFCFGATVSAKNNIIGKVICTDINAKIDGEFIPSYNINDYTAILAEDLSYYGFDVNWDENSRTLNVVSNITKRYWPIDTYDERYFEGEIIGSKLFDIYQTDIKVYLNGDEIDSFNIDGNTAIYIDSLSKYGKVVWNEDERIINVRRLDKNYPFRLSESDKAEAKKIGKSASSDKYTIEFGSKYMLANITDSRNIKLIDRAYFITPFSALCNSYYNAYLAGKDTLDFDVEEWLDANTSTQTLVFYVYLEGNTEDFYKYIRFGMMQGYTYIKCNKNTDDTPAVKNSESGKYEKFMAIYFPTLNAIDFTKPANFIATPQRGSIGETTIKVDFSKYK